MKVKRNIARAFVIASVPFIIGVGPVDARNFGNFKIVKGDLVSVSKDIITVSKDNEQFDIEVDGQAKVLSKYYAKIEPKDLKRGDLISIWGKWVDQAKTKIQAKLVRDLSQEIRKGLINGTFKNTDDAHFTVTRANGKEYKVALGNDTVIINRKGQTIVYTDLKDGDHLAVSGFLNPSNLTMAKTLKIRDLSLP